MNIMGGTLMDVMEYFEETFVVGGYSWMSWKICFVDGRHGIC